MRLGIVSVAVLAIAVVAMSGVLVFSDDSDALFDQSKHYDVQLYAGEYAEIDVNELTGGNYGKGVYDPTLLPPGLEIGDRDCLTISGYPSEIGEYSLKWTLYDKSSDWFSSSAVVVDFHIWSMPEKFTVTYDAGVGLVNGLGTWSEDITRSSYASLPDAVHSSGAYTFRGWALSKTSLDTVDSLTVDRDTTLYAVWERNAVRISDLSATVSQDQVSDLKVVTDPAESVVEITNYGGLAPENAILSGHDISLDMTSVPAGTYHIILTASYTGFLNGTSELLVNVPITVKEPIMYSLSLGDTFSYTPVTDPTNASISLKKVMFEGSDLPDLGCFSVSGRTVTGTPSESGTYEISYTASLPGYIEVTDTVVIFIADVRESSDPVSLSSVMSSSRSGEPRVFDFVAVGGSNVSNYVWTVDGIPFSSSSSTALYEFPTAGIYTVECTAKGFDGSSVTIPVEVVCDDSYHMRAAWSGMEYGYVVDGTPSVDVPAGSPFSVSIREVSDRKYTVISGTPTDQHVGRSYPVSVGGSDPVDWNITVYGRQSSAPVCAFDLSVSGRTVTASFTGSGASFWSFDFDGDGMPDGGDSFTYPKDGVFAVTCYAVNNVSQVSSSMKVEVGSMMHDNSTLDQLTDFQMVVGETIRITVLAERGDILLVEGSASGFVTVDGFDLVVSPQERGVFQMKILLQHPAGQPDFREIEVTVKDVIPEIAEIEHGYMTAIAVLFVIGIAAIALFLFAEDRGYLKGGRR